jgi:hypothetical protein
LKVTYFPSRTSIATSKLRGELYSYVWADELPQFCSFREVFYLSIETINETA